MKNGYVIKGFKPDGSDLEKINQFTCKDLTLEELYAFRVDLCNNDIDRDFECFSLEALNQLAEEFVGKTGIKNHIPAAENQLARIYETEVVKLSGRKTKTGDDFYVLRAKAYMIRTAETQDIIKEIDAGIKKEVSVSCSAASSICSVCGNNRKEADCGHIRGKSYDSRLCYYILRDITDAYEFSFVAIPAQKEAGVVKAFLNNKGEKDLNSIVKQLDFSGESTVLSKKDAQAIAAFISETEENARLGTEYKKGLVKELIRLCGKVVPQLDLKVFEGVANVMTAKELVAFKKAFEQNIAFSAIPSPQLAKAEANRINNNEFKI